MKYGSLFSGIGGLDLGLDRAGMECRWQVEIDSFCRKVLEKHWPDVPKYGDIKELSGDELEPVDLIAGGFPCQPVSVAGKQRRQADPRWLWPDFWRIASRVRPHFILVENVPGLFNGGFDQVLGDLAQGGYDAEWSVVSACSMGAPHLRERVFVLADDRSQRVQGCGKEALSRLPSFPWRENGRGLEALRGRSDLPEPLFRGASDGVPYWVDRLRALGNAVVPQVAQFIGERIMKVELR